MGDVRFRRLYEQLRDTDEPLRVIRSFTDTEVIGALAAAPRRDDPYLVNVLATEAVNRAERASAISATVGDGVCALDARGRVTFMNPAAERMLECTRVDLNGCRFEDAVHAPHAPGSSPCSIERARRESRHVMSDDESFRTVTGRVFPAHVTASPILRDDEVRGLVLVFHDITGRKHEERALRDRVALESAIARVSTRLVAPTDLPVALAACLEDLGRMRGASRVVLHCFTGTDVLPSSPVEWCADGVRPYKDATGTLVGASRWRQWLPVLERERAVIVNDLDDLGDEYAREKRELELAGVKSLLAFPVRCGRQGVGGVLALHDVTQPRAWSDSDARLMGVVADMIGTRLEHAMTDRDHHLLAYALDHAGEHVLLIGRDGRLRFASHRASARYGYDARELKARHVWDVNPDMTPELWSDAWKHLEEHGHVKVHTRHRARDGRTFPVIVRSTRVCFQGNDYVFAMVREAARAP